MVQHQVKGILYGFELDNGTIYHLFIGLGIGVCLRLIPDVHSVDKV